MDQAFKDLPITALSVISEKSKCPVRYSIVDKSLDTNSEIELWTNSLFGKKTNRYICFSKEPKINNSFNVIEDIKLFNERENIPYGYTSIEKTEDSLEKSFQRKVLVAKISPRYLTNEAISDIIMLAKNKRAPNGYLLVGEINNISICAKYSRILHRQAPIPTGIPPYPQATAISAYPQSTPPPLPPRPPNELQSRRNQSPGSNHNDAFMKTVQRIYDAPDNYNPLHGVPFQINPIYSKKSNSNNQSFNTDMIDKYTRLNDLLNKFHYDFNLERSIVGYSKN